MPKFTTLNLKSRFAFKRGDSVPKFHYETRAFSRVIRLEYEYDMLKIMNIIIKGKFFKIVTVNVIGFR